MRQSLTTARHSLLSSVRPLPADSVPLSEAAGRIVLETISARVSLPPSDCAAVDGYAVRMADLATGGGISLQLAGTVTAGQAMPLPLLPGCCIGVMTGAALPPGTDAVVPSEAARLEGGRVVAATVPGPWSGIRRAGAEARTGEVLLLPGAELDPRSLERLAGQGITRISVPRRARVHLVATGDELVPPGQEPKGGQRVASNLPMLEALVRSCGGQVERSLVAPDDPVVLREALTGALNGDLVLTVGGTLRGSKDLTKGVLADLGAVFLFDGVAMRPGASCAAATGGDATIVCLPGSPGAAFLTFAALARPFLRALHGWRQPIPAFVARLAEPLEPAREETLLIFGVVRDTTGGLEFRRQGQGWPALGMLSASAMGESRDPQIAVELLPQE